jgi:hypothetical protein
MCILVFLFHCSMAKRAKVSETILETPSLVSGENFDTLGIFLGPRIAEILSFKQQGFMHFFYDF